MLGFIVLILLLVLLLLVLKWAMEKFGVPNDIKNIILIIVAILTIAGRFAGWYTMPILAF